EFSAHPAPCAPGAQQVIQLLAIEREGRKNGEAFRSDLPIAARIVEPQRALALADRSDEGMSVRSECDSLFLRGARGDLLRPPVGKTLPPDVISVAGIGGDIHPLPIGRPGSVGTLRRRRTDGLSPRAAVEGRQPAGQPRTGV